MRIAVLKETKNHERRVAASPDSVRRFIKAGASIVIEKGAGVLSNISDAAFKEAGAEIAASAEAALKDAQIVLVVNMPEASTLKAIPKGAFLIGALSPFENKARFAECAKANIQAIALEFLPRISRAQSMDILSSQSNIAGYRAVIEAVAAGGKVIPMMMTAAGTVPPAKILVLGAGVAGLQAIATAKRLGAVASAFDVRPVVKEQVESLGATFIEVPAEESGETSGGYAKEMSEDYKRKQSELIALTLKTQDIVISTALIPGRPAPELITEAMLKDMKSGAIIVDMAAASGGNCKLTKPDAVTVEHGVTLIGYTDLPSLAAPDASPLYARNLWQFVTTLIIKGGELNPQWDDELVKGTLLSRDGALVHPTLADATTEAPAEKKKAPAKTKKADEIKE